VVRATLGVDAGVIGAALTARQTEPEADMSPGLAGKMAVVTVRRRKQELERLEAELVDKRKRIPVRRGELAR
jgi:hypothetical protein